jgi:hypothetical protein
LGRSQQAYALAGKFYRDEIAQNNDNPGEPQRGEEEAKKNLRILDRPVRIACNPTICRKARYAARARAFLLSNGYVLDDKSFDVFLKAFADAHPTGRRASASQHRRRSERQ